MTAAPHPARGLGGLLRRTRTDPALRREADMMGFYLGIALLAALTATGNDHAPHRQSDVLLLVWGTTIGLALAHWFAVVVSLRLVDDPDVHHTPGEMLMSQLIMAVGIAGVATVVVLVLSPDLERLGARVVAAVAITGIVGVESRLAGTGWRQVVLRGAAALLVGLAIAAVKWNVGK